MVFLVIFLIIHLTGICSVLACLQNNSFFIKPAKSIAAMDYFTYASKLERLKSLINKRSAGTSKLLATRLRVSERTVKRMIAVLRKQGMKINFNAKRKTYLSGDDLAACHFLTLMGCYI